MVKEQNPLSRINRRLRGCFYQDDTLREFLDDPYFWSGQGFRGGLCIEVGRCLGVESDVVTEIALFTELLHNASLIHDDILDRDEQRRGHATIWKKHGESKALLIGDLLIAKAFDVAFAARVDAVCRARWGSILSKTVLHAVKGACKELDFDLFREDSIVDRYHKMAKLKTGALFALPISCLASVAGLNSRDSASLTECFSDLAVAYQIRDDQSDFYGFKKGRKSSSDIANGRPNIYHLLSTRTFHAGDYEQDIAAYHSNLVGCAIDWLSCFSEDLCQLVTDQVLSFVKLNEVDAPAPSLRVTA